MVPRGGVTLLAQLTAGAFGTGWLYYAISLIVTIVLGIAANTSFGGLPVLMNLLAKDDRLPHHGRSAERAHRCGRLPAHHPADGVIRGSRQRFVGTRASNASSTTLPSPWRPSMATQCSRAAIKHSRAAATRAWRTRGGISRDPELSVRVSTRRWRQPVCFS
ncbi:hypothetical protein SMALB_1635 [Streptomyces malaysiensis]|uniref:Uncharacterized protein n=1 Tax=Streptomyces malaysiensis TaxID=92644 RepID=A0A7X5WZQ7_STRMQ|nr:hypothetical protein [Streptomyces malaysiensis]